MQVKSMSNVDFTDLHLHSTYSNLDGFGLPGQIVARAKEIGRTSIALTDHGSVSGLVKFWKACKEQGLKPIYGSEQYIVESLPKMFETKQMRKNHITVLAKNAAGYKNLLKIASLAYSEGFYYRPTISKEILFNNHEGLVVLSGCWTGFVQEHLKNNDLDGAMKIVSEFRDVFKDDYYLETQHFPLFKDTIDLLNVISEKFKIPMVLTCDPHYLNDDQAYVQEILHAIRDRRVFDESQIMYGAFQWPADMLFEAVSTLSKNIRWQELFENTCAVAEKCNGIEIPKGGVPKYPIKAEEEPYKLLLGLCKEGIIKRGLGNLQGEEKAVYNAQIQKELKLVKEKNFVDYFLIVADIVNWAKKKGILVGPARGSAAGSLLCYLTGITEINPLKYGLLFDRFLDESRFDLPDIDNDFEDDRRDEVKEYISKRYGADRVCSVGTFAQFKGRNSLDEIGKVYKIPPGDVSTVKKFLVERSGADMRIDLTISDTFSMSPQAAAVREAYPKIEDAIALEGQLRHMSMHAAGVIVGDRPLQDVMGIYEKDGVKISSVAMEDASALGLVKIDILGITELSIIAKICVQIGLEVSDVYKIPLDDVETLRGFEEIDVEGIFQFEGDSTKSVLRQLPKLDFESLIACVTLSKPGPAHCVAGGTLIYDCDHNEIISIAKAYKLGVEHTLSLYPDGSIKSQRIKKIHRIGSWRQNRQKTFRVVFKNGRIIQATTEHQFLTPDGFRKLFELNIGDKVLSTNKKIWNRGTIGTVKPNSGNWQKGHAPWNKDIKWPEASALRKQQWIDGIYENTGFAVEKVTNHDWYSIGVTEIIRIEEAEECVVYDLEMEDVPNYLANGIVVHNSGSTGEYISGARGEKVKGLNWHHVLNEATKDTYGQIIYQEQVLKIVREVGKMTWTDANKIRQFMAHSEGEQAFEGYWPAFQTGATQNGLDEKQARIVWDTIKTMGRWTFNKSHAVSYAIVAWWSMYFKRHYPVQFYWARLVREKEESKRYRLLLEINKRGIKILPPVVGKSDGNWKIEGENSLRAGFTGLKGVGEKTALKILESNAKSIEELKNKKIKGISKKHIEALEAAEKSDDFFGLNKFGVLGKISPMRQKLEDLLDHGKQYDIEVAGVFVEMNYKDIHEERRSRGKSTADIKNPEIAKYAMLLLEDETDRCLVNIDRYLFNKIGEKVWEAYHNGNFVVIKGIKVSGWRIVRARDIAVYDAEGHRVDGSVQKQQVEKDENDF